MIISLINGSQKTEESNSGIILYRLNELIEEKHEIKCYNCSLKPFTDEIFKEIITGDIIVLAFPLFVHSIPSNTLKILIKLEKYIKKEQTNNLIIYTIINNGFYEGKQNYTAFEIIKNWCERSGEIFGGGIGQGAGEMIAQTKNIPLNRGPFKNLAQALQVMAEHIILKKSFDVIYLSPYFPKFLWKFMAVRYWHKQAKNNGITKKDISKKL
jgi:multimeric flavodoxin WrbA